jgi:hypothetical protein
MVRARSARGVEVGGEPAGMLRTASASVSARQAAQVAQWSWRKRGRS